MQYLEETKRDFEEIQDTYYSYALAVITFFSRETSRFLAYKETKEILNFILSLPTFNERAEAFKSYINDVAINILSSMAEKCINIYSQDWINEELDYAEEIGIDAIYDKAIIYLIERIYFNQAIKTDFQYFLEIFLDTFEIAKKIIKDIDLTKYETILNKKVNIDDMILSIEHIENLFFHKFDTEKAFTQFKIKNHHLSFLFEDNLVTSSHTGEPILEKLTAGLINIAVSESLINIVNKKDESKFKSHIETLKLFNVEEEKISLVEDLLLLIKSKKFIKHIPSVVLSNAYGGLGENQVFALSKFLLPSLNLITAKTHYPKLNFIIISTEITYFEEGSYFFD